MQIENLDAEMNAAINKDPNLMVPWYLMASYLYYICDTSLLTDPAFDQLCVNLLGNWDSIEHKHKAIVHEEDLPAGTGCSIAAEHYPSIVKSAATRLVRKYGIVITTSAD